MDKDIPPDAPGPSNLAKDTSTSDGKEGRNVTANGLVNGATNGNTEGNEAVEDISNNAGLDGDSISVTSAPLTSTPLRGEINVDAVAGNVRFDTDSVSVTDTVSRDSISSRESLIPEQISVPIQGYEIMEERAKFTVFKIKVEKTERDSWFVFRRYTDFVQLNEKLRRRFPRVRLSLPPKRWFKDNFDKDFIEDRVLGLQAFINNCIGHKDICNSLPVREFFCFDDPPGPHDSLEESRALCENLEEAVYRMRKELSEKDSEISLLNEELDLYKKQVEMLSQALREKNAGNRSLESPASMGGASLTDYDLSTCPEADQPQHQVTVNSNNSGNTEINNKVTGSETKKEGSPTQTEDKGANVPGTKSSKKKIGIFNSKNRKSPAAVSES